MLLDEFVSNQNVKSELSECMENGNIPHAIIIDGAEGTGKKTLADIISKYCICIGNVPNHKKPCGLCSGCIKAEHGSHPDIYKIDGKVSGMLSIDNIRKMRSDVYVKPNEAPAKVYILSDCDKMLAPAQNALLKILEEPPGDVVFILTVSSANMLLQTVRSRARVFSLFPAGIKEAAEYLKNNSENNYESCLDIAENCGGNIGIMLERLKENEDEARTLANDILKAVGMSSEYNLLLLTSKLSTSRDFAVRTLDCMLELISLAIKESLGIETGSQSAAEISMKLSVKRISVLAEKIQNARNILNTNVNLNFFGAWLSSVLKTK